MYTDKYKKALSLIDEMCEKLQHNKLIIENDEFNVSLNNIKHILTQKTFKVAIVGAIKSGKSTMLMPLALLQQQKFFILAMNVNL